MTIIVIFAVVLFVAMATEPLFRHKVDTARARRY